MKRDVNYNRSIELESDCSFSKFQMEIQKLRSGAPQQPGGVDTSELNKQIQEQRRQLDQQRQQFEERMRNVEGKARSIEEKERALQNFDVELKKRKAKLDQLEQQLHKVLLLLLFFSVQIR